MVDADWIKIGIEAVGLIGGGLGVFFGLRSRLDVVATKVEMHAVATAAAIADLKAEMKPVADLGTKVALLDQRMTLAEKKIDELAHGEGRVLPLIKGHYER